MTDQLGVVRVVLAVPGVLSEPLKSELKDLGVEVLDGPKLYGAAQQAGLSEAMGSLASPAEQQVPSIREPADELERRLLRMPPGRVSWSGYQKLCGEILTFLFHPPLERPIGESANRSGVNRRDFVIPNYATDGFWAYLRTSYAADYVVVDSKNYTGSIKKQAILQLANYLSRHGAGLFGIVVARNAGDRSAEITRREQWLLQQKLIVVIDDGDLRQMLAVKKGGGEAEEVIRQKIEDFRLGF